jgi:hypothetical protein
MSWALQDEPLEELATAVGHRGNAGVQHLWPAAHLVYAPPCPRLFIDGTQPTVYDNMYQEFAINRETGRLATLYTPPELMENRELSCASTRKRRPTGCAKTKSAAAGRSMTRLSRP